METDSGDVRRILVRGVNWVGDTILTYPTLESLKRLFPEAKITILVPAHLADLWRTFPYVDEIVPFRKRSGIRAVLEDFRIGRILRKERFDLSLVLPRSFRSAFQVYLARIPVRIGYRDEGRSMLLTQAIPRRRELLRVHRVYYYHELLKPLGHRGEPPSPLLPLREGERRWADGILEEKGIRDGTLLIGLSPGAAYGSAKCWPTERFGELGRRLSRDWKATVAIFGSETERRAAREIVNRSEGKALDFTGKTDLLQLAALLERCALLITNDTGTMHVATAVGTPVVAIFGPTDPLATGPWGEGHLIVKKEVPCTPCFKRVCPTDHRCMDQITVEEVEELVDKKLKTILNNQTSSTKHQINSNHQ